MKFKDYQAWCAKIWTKDPLRRSYTLHDDYIMSTGLAGECGEVLELLKKAVRDHRDITLVDKKELTLEMGDVLYYWMVIAHRHGLDPKDIIDANVEKLTERFKNRT